MKEIADATASSLDKEIIVEDSRHAYSDSAGGVNYRSFRMPATLPE